MPLRIVCPFLCVVAVATAAAAQTTPVPASPSTAPSIAGVWVLNPALTQKPEEIGFNPGLPAASGDRGSGSSGGGRGRRGGSSGGSGGSPGIPQFARESIEDSTRVQQLTGEARTPPAHLTIVQKPDSIAIADDQGHSRTFHPDGRVEELAIGTVVLPTRSQWDSGEASSSSSKSRTGGRSATRSRRPRIRRGCWSTSGSSNAAATATK